MSRAHLEDRNGKILGEYYGDTGREAYREALNAMYRRFTEDEIGSEQIEVIVDYDEWR